MERRIESRIVGRGLGFDFQSWIQRLAAQFPIKGAISTKADGSIKIVAEGDESALIEFERRLRRGSRFSTIEIFDVDWKEVGPEQGRFFMVSY